MITVTFTNAASIASISLRRAANDAARKIAASIVDGREHDDIMSQMFPAPTDDEKASVAAVINELVNAAAVLDGIPTRDDWSEGMIADWIIEIEAADRRADVLRKHLDECNASGGASCEEAFSDWERAHVAAISYRQNA